MMPQRNTGGTAGAWQTGGLNLPPENMNTNAMQGTMQQALSENLGRYVVVDFLIGVSTIVRRVGILYFVGRGFLVLYEEVTQTYHMCDIFSVKFVAFFPPGFHPSNTENNMNTSGILSQSTRGAGLNYLTQDAVPGQGPIAMSGTEFLGSMNGGGAMPTRSPETMGGCSGGNCIQGGY
ncbi:MAG: hypothetical protein HFF09_02330 [Oscillospiraceae bacterium]|nr:hypothetical protein [Oscillospiraceae bacterium]